MLGGVAPMPASSGKSPATDSLAAGTAPPTTRCTASPWSAGPTTHTRDYVARQLASGRYQKEILRLLKRAIAREMFKHLTAPCPIDDYSDLRPARQAKNITLTVVAERFGVWPNDISRLERGLKRDDTLATNYRQWLTPSSHAA